MHHISTTVDDVSKRYSICDMNEGVKPKIATPLPYNTARSSEAAVLSKDRNSLNVFIIYNRSSFFAICSISPMDVSMLRFSRRSLMMLFNLSVSASVICSLSNNS